MLSGFRHGNQCPNHGQWDHDQPEPRATGTNGTPAVIVQADLEKGLADLGVRPGARMMVHSSLSSFGRVDGGPDAVIRALKAVVGPAGTIVMPSFNHGAPFTADGPGVFDPTRTHTTNGAIPDRFWRLPETYRSLNPTHAFAAWGANAEELVSRHHLGTTMGPGSPLHRLWQAGGAVLLLGVGFLANTFHHVVECAVGAPCLGVRTEEYPVRTPDGSIEMLPTWGWRERSCPITDENRYGAALMVSGAVRERTIGQARCLLVSMHDCHTVVSRLLHHGLPPYPPCSKCPIRPRRVKWTVQ